MTFQTVILLSLIQGITEFLPISSSAHLMLFPILFDIKDQGIIADLFAHIGSLLAVMFYYRKDIKDIIISLFNKKYDRSMFYNLFIATIPIVIIGIIFVLFKIKFRDPRIVIYTSLIFGTIFFLADKFGKKDLTIKKLSLRDAFLIGSAQTFASIPGSSRSGTTLTCALMLGYKRQDALKFSFLLSIPTIILVGLGGILKFALNPETINIYPLILISIFSFIFSLISIRFIMFWLKHLSFKPFAIYRIILGIILYLYLK